MLTTEHVLTETTFSERVRYFPRQLITADDMRLEQEYFREKLRRHNRYLHGTGVVCGLKVTAKPTSKSPLQIEIASGYALDPQGDEIYVPRAVPLDLATCGSTKHDEECKPTDVATPTADENKELFVVLKYHECQSRPVRVTPAGCGCDDSACEYSRIRDSFELCCLPTNPEIKKDETKDEGSCPAPATHPWVLLAKVTLPSDQITAANIQDLRKAVLSNAVT